MIFNMITFSRFILFKILIATVALIFSGCQHIVGDSRTSAQKKVDGISLFDGSGLDNWELTDYVGKGDVKIDKNGSLILEMGSDLTGIHWKNKKILPKINYEISLEARRTLGSDFFCGLTFPFNESHATLILGGWGGALIGISSIDGYDASENETGDAYIFEENKWYKIKLKVSPENLSVWIDQDKVIDCDLEGREVGMRFGEIEMSIPLGICSYATSSEIRNIKLIELE